ncbi:hypothetical protein [Sorangium sp. So ce1000]|uniref:hypothetical protein n=1 Tax=Sorangium sp. So ce1000 TaxID=3133325 RepID=UPI003F627080
MPEEPSTLRPKLFLEDAFTGSTAPQTLVVAFPSPVHNWQNRTSFDALVKWMPSKRLTFTFSDRLNVIEQDGQDVLSWQTVRNDLREGYVTWEPASDMFLEAGRINVRNGVALGFNPTDFFKTRSLVGQASLDPSVIRQNRLGAVMARWQALWNGGSASVAFAPKLTDPTAVLDPDRNGLDPRFDATNAAYRLLSTLSFNVLDLNPEVLAYVERDRSKLGVNISRPIGDAVVGYAEWAGGFEKNLATRAVEYGKATGTLPEAMPMLLPADESSKFRNDVAAGFSWVIATKVTLNLEYHFHQAGFTRQDWRNWFETGSDPAPALISSALWYPRGYAIDQQEPTSTHQLFVRAAWPKAFVNDLELSGFAFVNLLDGSVLTQIAANYYASDKWTLAAYGSANIGDGRTERGSLPQRLSGILSIVRYL